MYVCENVSVRIYPVQGKNINKERCDKISERLKAISFEFKTDDGIMEKNPLSIASSSRDENGGKVGTSMLAIQDGGVASPTQVWVLLPSPPR